MRQRLQRQRRVVNLDDQRQIRCGAWSEPFGGAEGQCHIRSLDQIASPPVRHHDAAGAGRQRRRCEIRTVQAFATNGDIELARAESPRVDRYAGEVARGISRHHTAPHRLGHPARHETNLVHSRTHAIGYTTPELVRRRPSASRATATSSNGNTRSPITWYFS